MASESKSPELESPEPESKIRFDASILNQLACPACFTGLRPADTQLVCTGCGRGYPIIDGIPVLIVERAMRKSGL